MKPNLLFQRYPSMPYEQYNKNIINLHRKLFKCICIIQIYKELLICCVYILVLSRTTFCTQDQNHNARCLKPQHMYYQVLRYKFIVACTIPIEYAWGNFQFWFFYLSTSKGGQLVECWLHIHWYNWTKAVIILLKIINRTWFWIKSWNCLFMIICFVISC